MRSEPHDAGSSSEKVVLQYADESTDALVKSHFTASSTKKDELVGQEREVRTGRSRLMRTDTSASLGSMVYSSEYGPSRSSSRAALSDNMKYCASRSDVNSSRDVSRERERDRDRDRDRDRHERRQKSEGHHHHHHRGSSASHIGNSSSVDEFSTRSYKQQQQQQYDDYESSMNARDSRRSSRSSLHSIQSNRPYPTPETTSPPQPLLPAALVRELSAVPREDSENWDSSSLSTHDSHGNVTCYRGYTQRKSITSMDPRLPDSDLLPRSRKSSRDETVESRARRMSRDDTEIRMRRSSREELEGRRRRSSRDENHSGTSGISRERRSSSVKEGKIHVSHRDLNSSGGSHDHHGRSTSSLHHDVPVSNGQRYSSDQNLRSRDYHRSHERSSMSYDLGEKTHDHGENKRDYQRSQSSQEIRAPHRSRRQDNLSRENHPRDSVRSRESVRSQESTRSYFSERSRDGVISPEWDSPGERERYERRHRRDYEHAQPTIISEMEPDVISLEAQPPEVDRGRRKSSFDRLATIHHEKFKISEYNT